VPTLFRFFIFIIYKFPHNFQKFQALDYRMFQKGNFLASSAQPQLAQRSQGTAFAAALAKPCQIRYFPLLS
jgi:hypothetical protein